MLAWALTALLAVVVPVRDGTSAAPAQAQQVIIGSGGSDGFNGDGALAQSNGVGNGGNGGSRGSERNQGGRGGHDGDGRGGGSINAGTSGSGGDRGIVGAGNSGGPLQVVVPRPPGVASGHLAGITSPPTFPSFTPPGVADSWNANHDLAVCALMLERVTHVGSEVYSLSFLQPTLSQCSDPLSLNFGWVRDHLALRLKASTVGANDPTPVLSGSASGAISNLAVALEYTPAERLSWTVERLTSGPQVTTQTSLRYAPAAGWYTLLSQSGSSVGDGMSSTAQQVEVGYQSFGGPQVALRLGRQLYGIVEYDTTSFTVSTSLQDVSVQFEYSVSALITSPEEPSPGQTSYYPALRFAFPMLGWLWTVTGTMAEGSNVMVDVFVQRNSLSAGLSLTPLDFRLSYQANL